ncbi:transcriptional regulators [Limimaricola cinnabarinus LL-001]|uniref:Transcriptional regulators n=2 Tax=Limimaricola cinnabarinus TaxID=1125964 RepID=U3ADA9_9RHOB|nr:transcriptional regulators [Limimaricola cinnabarinus LL-001]
MMNSIATPAELVRTSVTFWTLMAETQAVMAYRIMGMAGLWAVTGTENTRMVDEKGPAFAEAMVAGNRAMMSGKRPDQVAMATMLPLQRRTALNNKRLAKRGPNFLKMGG